MMACIELIARHARCNWDTLSVFARDENELAIQNGECLMFVYHTPQGEGYVITERDRPVTTVLMAEDY